MQFGYAGKMNHGDDTVLECKDRAVTLSASHACSHQPLGKHSAIHGEHWYCIEGYTNVYH